MTDKNVIKQNLITCKPFLQQNFHVKRIGFFGSYARGQQTDNSDVDVLVEFSRPVGLQFIALKEYLEQQFGKPVDLVTPNALKPQLKQQILADIVYT